MKKNVAGQNVSAVLINNSDGSNFSGTCTVYVQGDASAQAIGTVGSGIATSMGNGQYRYAPSQAETNYDQVNFIFTGSGAGTEMISFDTTYPQTGDNYVRLGAPAGASVSADIAAVNAKTTNLPAAPASTTNITGGTITTVSGNVNGSVASVSGNVGGNVVGSVASVVGNVGGVTATVNADVKKINGTTVNGNGTSPPWGP